MICDVIKIDYNGGKIKATILLTAFVSSQEGIISVDISTPVFKVQLYNTRPISTGAVERQ